MNKQQFNVHILSRYKNSYVSMRFEVNNFDKYYITHDVIFNTESRFAEKIFDDLCIKNALYIASMSQHNLHIYQIYKEIVSLNAVIKLPKSICYFDIKLKDLESCDSLDYISLQIKKNDKRFEFGTISGECVFKQNVTSDILNHYDILDVIFLLRITKKYYESARIYLLDNNYLKIRIKINNICVIDNTFVTIV